MRTLALSALLVAALPAMAQAPPPPPPPNDSAEQPKPAMTMKERLFVGGGIGVGFGTVDFVSIEPLVGFRVAPRFDLGVQPIYRWTRDSRYSPSLSTTDYGASVFMRVRIVKNFYGEADFQYLSYQYLDAFGTELRASHNAFLAGGGYTIPAGRNVGIYLSALYDFTYDSNDLYYPYASPFRYQVGVAVGF